MTRRTAMVALVSLAVSAPIAFVAVGAGPLLAEHLWRWVAVPLILACIGHPGWALGVGIVGALMTVAGLLGVGLARRAGVDMPPVPRQPDALDRELDQLLADDPDLAAMLLNADATNPRGVRVPVQPHAREGRP